MKNNKEGKAMTGTTNNIRKEALHVLITNKDGGHLPTKGLGVIKKTNFVSDKTKIVVDNITTGDETYYITHEIG